MPSFAALSDENIANVATYIRNAWSNRAGAVSAKEVAKLRKELRPVP
jgi:mono/diheme cytochrome c family protein